MGSLKNRPRHRNLIVSDQGDFIYHIGIIDFLQDYSFAKKAETAFKTMSSKGNEANFISCVSPHRYAFRFVRYIQENVLLHRKEEDSMF